jgi:hypothetical protein
MEIVLFFFFGYGIATFFINLYEFWRKRRKQKQEEELELYVRCAFSLFKISTDGIVWINVVEDNKSKVFSSFSLKGECRDMFLELVDMIEQQRKTDG